MDFTNLFKEIINVVIMLSLSLITLVIVPWIKSKFDDNQIKIIRIIVDAAVMAAEQIYKAGNGEQKLQYAIDIVSKELAKRGIRIDAEVLRAYIEASVNEWFAHE